MVEFDSDKTKVSAVSVGIAGLAVIIALIVLPVFSSDTIFLTTKEGGIPDTCAPANGLVLAQNMTDLCDVTIISPTTNQIIQYNGSQWVNVASAPISGNATCANLGTGTIVCPSYGNSNINLKSFLAGIGLSISNSSTTITYTNAGVLHTIAGTGISVNQTSGNILVTNTLPESTVCNNSANGQGLCINNTITLKNLLGGTGISLGSNSTNVTITNSAPESTVCNNATSSAGHSGICKDNTITLRNIKSSTGISTSVNSTDVVITNTGVISLTSADTETLSYSGPTGGITATPKLSKLCSAIASGGETVLNCTLSNTGIHSFLVQSMLSASGGTAPTFAMRFNNDSGTNYSTRSSANGGADTTVANQAQLINNALGNSQDYIFSFMCGEISASHEKFCYGDRDTSVAGAGSSPTRTELVIKWANTTDLISSFNIVRTAGTSTLDDNSYVQIWGVVT